MRLFCAILCVVFFHVIAFTRQRDMGLIGVLMFTQPLVGAVVGVPLLLMAGSCFGRQTPMKVRLGLVGTVLLQVVCGLMIFLSDDPGVTFFTSIPFLACSIALELIRATGLPRTPVRIPGEK